MYYMPGLVWKSVNGEKRLVMRWKKRINGKLKITKEMYIGDMDNLADMIEHPLKDSHVISLDFGTTAFVRMIDAKIGMRDIVNSVITHKGNGMSPGDYMLLFIMNRLSDPCSKNGLERWMYWIHIKYLSQLEQSPHRNFLYLQFLWKEFGEGYA